MPNLSQPLKKAFTLIELLVVISIIAILATLLIANFNATRERARDAQRKSDLRNIQTALRLYYNDYGVYPDNSGGEIKGCGDGDDPCTFGSGAFSAQQVYMSLLPDDPQTGRGYVYSQEDEDIDNYTLSVCLENVSDDKCDTGEGGDPVGCGDDYGNGLSGCTYSVSP